MSKSLFTVEFVQSKFDELLKNLSNTDSYWEMLHTITNPVVSEVEVASEIIRVGAKLYMDTPDEPLPDQKREYISVFVDLLSGADEPFYTVGVHAKDGTGAFNSEGCYMLLSTYRPMQALVDIGIVLGKVAADRETEFYARMKARGISA